MMTTEELKNRVFDIINNQDEKIRELSIKLDKQQTVIRAMTEFLNKENSK